MRSALITGAGRRIGRAVALDLATNGWRIVLHYHQSPNEAAALAGDIEAAGGSAVLVPADLGDPEAARALVDRAFDAAPELELVINNASSFAYDDARTATAEALHANFSVNAVAPIMIAQRFAQRLPQGRTGSLVMLLDNRVFAPNPDYFSYGISKFAGLGATQMLALALAPRVRVNGVAPGITLPSGKQSAENFAVAHSNNPLQRGCAPEDIARAVRFIADTPAMTGAIITIDGGASLANPGRDVAYLPRLEAP